MPKNKTNSPDIFNGKDHGIPKFGPGTVVEFDFQESVHPCIELKYLLSHINYSFQPF